MPPGRKSNGLPESFSRRVGYGGTRVECLWRTDKGPEFLPALVLSDLQVRAEIQRFRRRARIAPIMPTPTSQTSALPGSGISVVVIGMLTWKNAVTMSLPQLGLQ